MALTAPQTQTVYEACGLRSEGGTYYLIRFDAFSMADMESTSLTWDYSNIKTVIDANLAALSANAETRLGTYITKYDQFATSSIKLQGEVVFDAERELGLAGDRIVNIVGVQVARVDPIENARERLEGGRQGSVRR